MRFVMDILVKTREESRGLPAGSDPALIQESLQSGLVSITHKVKRTN